MSDICRKLRNMIDYIDSWPDSLDKSTSSQCIVDYTNARSEEFLTYIYETLYEMLRIVMPTASCEPYTIAADNLEVFKSAAYEVYLEKRFEKNSVD